jgi:hypothetical protein
MSDEEIEKLNWQGRFNPIREYDLNSLIIYSQHSFSQDVIIVTLLQRRIYNNSYYEWHKLDAKEIDRFFTQLTTGKVEFALCETLERAVKV